MSLFEQCSTGTNTNPHQQQPSTLASPSAQATTTQSSIPQSASTTNVSNNKRINDAAYRYNHDHSEEEDEELYGSHDRTENDNSHSVNKESIHYRDDLAMMAGNKDTEDVYSQDRNQDGQQTGPGYYAPAPPQPQPQSQPQPQQQRRSSSYHRTMIVPPEDHLSHHPQPQQQLSQRQQHPFDENTSQMTSSPIAHSLRSRSDTAMSSMATSTSSTTLHTPTATAYPTPVETTVAATPMASVPPPPMTTQQLQQQYRKAKSRSGSVSSTTNATMMMMGQMKVPAPSLPPIPHQHLHQNQHQGPGRSVIVNMNGNTGGSGSHSLSNPPSPGKTGWEREPSGTTPTTPTPHSHSQHQHSSSLFDFFRTRKQSVSKSASGGQQHPPAVMEAAVLAGMMDGCQPLPEISGPLALQTTTMAASLPGPSSAVAPAGASVLGSIPGHTTVSTPTPVQTPAPALPLMGTPPTIAKSRMGPPPGNVSYPKPPPMRKQSLDVSMLSRPSGGPGPGPMMPMPPVPGLQKHAATMPIHMPSSALNLTHSRPGSPLASVITAPGPGTGNSGSLATSAQSTLTRVAQAVVGATVGKRRPSAASELESGHHHHHGLFGRKHHPNETAPAALPKTGSGSGSLPQQPPQHPHQQRHHQGLDAEQLRLHSQFMKPYSSTPLSTGSEKSVFGELIEYIDRLYHTVLAKDVSLEYSRKQISILQKELDQLRMQSEEEKKGLMEARDGFQEQVLKMEENFLLWRTRVHQDQMSVQEEYLEERLVKQDRIEELEEELSTSQEEVNRLRSRLLILEYEDDYQGPHSLLNPAHQQQPQRQHHTTINMSHPPPTNSRRNSHAQGNSDMNDSGYYNTSGSSSSTLSSSVSSKPGTTATTEISSALSSPVEYGPMTVAAHKRRSGDFRVIELRAETLEGQVQEMMQRLEGERRDHEKDLQMLKNQVQMRCSKLEQEVQAAKMESTMYNEMLHEVVTENDSLRSKVKDTQRKLHQHQQNHSSNNNTRSNAYTNATTTTAAPKRSSYGFGFFGSSISSAPPPPPQTVTGMKKGNTSMDSLSSSLSNGRSGDYYSYPGGFDLEGSEDEDDMEEIAF